MSLRQVVRWAQLPAGLCLIASLAGCGDNPAKPHVTIGWTRQIDGPAVYDVWSSGSDVFVVGSGGAILHYNGATWSAQSSVTAQSLAGVWGSTGSDVYAVGANGTILHDNGIVWSAQTSGTDGSLYGVWGGSAKDVFAVGASILHYGEQVHYPVVANARSHTSTAPSR